MIWILVGAAALVFMVKPGFITNHANHWLSRLIGL